MSLAERWFKDRSFTPLQFQREVWSAIHQGQSGLLHATTGSGKTLAVWMGALNLLDDPRPPPLGVLWITPMRALAADTARALAEPLVDLGLRLTVGVRTGDTKAAERARQNKRFPTAPRVSRSC